jgi:hypothetical protein
MERACKYSIIGDGPCLIDTTPASAALPERQRYGRHAWTMLIADTP